MHNVMLIWDARQAPILLNDFIHKLVSLSTDFDVKLNVLQLDYQFDLQLGKIKYGLRSLLDQVHVSKPEIILCFGSQANMLGKLLKPALRVPLIRNVLPSCLDKQHSTSSTLDKITQKFSEHYKWETTSDNFHFIPTMPNKTHFDGQVALIIEDPLGPVLSNLIQQQRLPYTHLYKQQILEHFYDALSPIDLLVISSRADKDGRLIHCANACGIPVVLVSQDPIAQLIKDGYNGWVINSVEDARLVRCLQNWRDMSEDAKSILSQYSQEHQSERNGIHHFFSSIGIKKIPPFAYLNKKSKSA